VIGELGELVITAPMPSMPVGFWGDPDGKRYREAYFDVFPGVWRHGDWITIGADGSCVITGRSDATLNRGGVRLGTAEFYSVVEGIDGVADSVVVHLDEDGDELLLFVVLADGVELDDKFRGRIRSELRPRCRRGTSPTRSIRYGRCRAPCPPRSSRYPSSASSPARRWIRPPPRVRSPTRSR